LPLLSIAEASDRADRWNVARWFVLACVCTTGCSLALSGPHAKPPRNEPPQCDTGKGVVTLDAIAGVGFGITAAAMAGSNTNSSAAFIPAAVAAAYFGAALRGNGVVNDCRKAMEEYSAPPPASAPPSYGEETPMRSLAHARLAPTPAVVMPQPQLQPPQPESPQPEPPPSQPATPSSAGGDPWVDFWKEVR
jgi:hypothetical protein